MSSTTLVLVVIVAGLISMAGCMAKGDRIAKDWIAEMDARPADEQVPNWSVIRDMMMRKAPVVGDPAPDFALETDDGAATIRLSDFRGTRPVVLIFGSWT